MARGSYAKEEITKKILDTFPGSFIYDKIIRIPIVENGETIQVKVSLVAAKDNVDVGGDAAIPTQSVETTTEKVEITEEEKKETLDLLKAFGF